MTIVRDGGADQCGADGADVYEHAGLPNGGAQITVATKDGAVTTTSTIGITVTPVADITNDTVTTNEDTRGDVST